MTEINYGRSPIDQPRPVLIDSHHPVFPDKLVKEQKPVKVEPGRKLGRKRLEKRGRMGISPPHYPCG